MYINGIHRKIGLQYFAEPAESGAPAEGGSEAGSQEGNQGAKTFTQEQVNGMMAAEKRSARNAMLKSLGYEVKDGAKVEDIVANIKGILDQGKTQQQKDKEAKDAAETAKVEAESKVISLQAQLDAMKAGVKPDYVEDAIALLMPRVTEEKPLSKLLEEYRSKYPAWFGESNGSKGTGGSANPPRHKGEEAGSMGKRLAQAGKTAAKSSYFHN